MCTFARQKDKKKQTTLWRASRRGSQCCVTLGGAHRAVSVLKIAYHRKFSEGTAQNSPAQTHVEMFENAVSLVWLGPAVSHYTVLPYTQGQMTSLVKKNISGMSLTLYFTPTANISQSIADPGVTLSPSAWPHGNVERLLGFWCGIYLNMIH